MSKANASLNASLEQTQASWGFLTVFQLACNILAVCTNGFVLGVFLRRPALRSPFKIYLILLLACNLLNAITAGPFDVYGNMYEIWQLGTQVCTYYLFFSWLLQAIILTVHFAITANRMWAVFFPHHYRSHHSGRLALVVCLLLTLSGLLLVSPFVLLDATIYRLPTSDNGCHINFSAQWAYLAFLQLVYYDVPVMFPIAMYPLLWYKHFQRSHSRIGNSALQKEPARTTGNYERACLSC